MALTYRHNLLTVVPLIDETVSLFATFASVSGGGTAVRVSYTTATGGTLLADLTGSGLAVSGAALTGGTVNSIRFFGTSGSEVGLLEGLGLTAAALTDLGTDRREAGLWLMAQDWTTNFTHAFQQRSDHPAGSTLADGTKFELRGDDFISLGTNGDRFATGRGNDILYGRNGADTLDGGKGNDTVKGNQGDDVLAGGRGDDDLYGGSGKDRLGGGRGADDFVFEVDFGDTGLGLGGTDTIADFEDGIDRIRIEMAAVGVTGMAAVSIEDSGPATLVRIAYSSGGQDLVQKIKLAGVDHLLIDAADFMFA
jgi:Ca2+-binding RTX toxin-like protein